MPKNPNILELLEEYDGLLEWLDKLRLCGDNEDLLSCLGQLHDVSEPLVERLRDIATKNISGLHIYVPSGPLAQEFASWMSEAGEQYFGEWLAEQGMSATIDYETIRPRKGVLEYTEINIQPRVEDEE